MYFGAWDQMEMSGELLSSATTPPEKGFTLFIGQEAV
jgi:hypothetical protein